MTRLKDRFRGALLGLACGDALGVTLEFTKPGRFTPIDDMVGSGPYGLQPGEWTDDTSMALCLAESLIETGGFNPQDQMERYVRWWREGYLSSTGACFDIGRTTRQALQKFWDDKYRYPFVGATDPQSAGNGSLMRIAPVPMMYLYNPSMALHFAEFTSKMTHGLKVCMDACRYMTALMIGALRGVPKAQLLDRLYEPYPDCWRIALPSYWGDPALCREIDEVANGSFKRKQPPEIRGSGYVENSLEAALWAFYHSSTFQEGALLAVNLGEDADTTGAIYGQQAGAYYGESGIPAHWINKVVMVGKIRETADQLFELNGLTDATLSAPSQDARIRATERMTGRFADELQNWGLTLSNGILGNRRPGTMEAYGWLIEWMFGRNEWGEYMEYQAIHRMTSPTHVRVYQSGRN